jgi:hypothetical protein
MTSYDAILIALAAHEAGLPEYLAVTFGFVMGFFGLLPK